MREQRFGMYLPIVFLVLTEIIFILHNGKGANASTIQRWPKGNKVDAMKVDPSSTESTDLQSDDPEGLLEIKVSERLIFENITNWLSSILCAILRLIFRQSYLFMSGGEMTWIQDIFDLLNPFKPAIPEPESAEPSEDVQSLLTSVLDYFNPFKPDTSHEKDPPPVDKQTNLIESAIDYFNPFKSAAIRSSIDFSDLLWPLFDVPQHSGPDGDFKNFVRSFIEFLRQFSTAALSVDLDQYFRPYINSLEDCTLAINPCGLINRMEPFQPANGDTGCIELNTDVSNPATDRPKPHKTVRNVVYPGLRRAHALRHGSLGATNSLASNSRKALYLHRLRPNYLRRPTLPKRNCPNVPSDYHRVKGLPNFYKLHTSNMNWNNARLKCQIEGAQLALPENQSQYDVMTDYTRSIVDGSDSRFYVGFHRVSSGDAWTTILGDPLPFENWSNDATGENLRGKQCGVILVSDSGGEGFASEPCAHSLPFMCQMTIPPKCV